MNLSRLSAAFLLSVLFTSFMRSLLVRHPHAVGSAVGLSLSALLFLTVPMYHDLVVWSWHQPWLWAVGLPAGVLAAVLTD